MYFVSEVKREAFGLDCRVNLCKPDLTRPCEEKIDNNQKFDFSLTQSLLFHIDQNQVQK